MASRQATSDQFAILADQRRRHALEILRGAELPLPLDALARAIVARDRGVPDDAVDDESVEQCTTTLYHKHLPKMDAADVIDVDWEQLTITNAERVAIPTIDGSVS